MKPFVKNPSKTQGDSNKSKKTSWSFQRKMIANLKRQSRRKKRRGDKLNVNSET